MKIIRTKWRDELVKEDQTNDENPLETKTSPLTGAIVAITVGAGIVIILICLAAFSVHVADFIVKFFK